MPVLPWLVPVLVTFLTGLFVLLYSLAQVGSVRVI